MAMEKSALNQFTPEENLPALLSEKSQARVIAITSGKGGVGKTNVSANLGIALAREGKRVCVLDADLGLANITILLGIYPELTIEDLFTSNRNIEELVAHGPEGLAVIPGASSLGMVSSFSDERHSIFVKAMEKLERLYDYILIDTSAGISDAVLSFISASHEAIVIVSPEPTSLTDAYSLLKVMKSKGVKKQVYTLVNMVLSYEDSVKIFNRFNSTTKKFLNIDMKYLGYVMTDQIMVASVIQQKPVMVLNPESTPGHCFTLVAGKLETRFSAYEGSRFSENWKKISGPNSGQETQHSPLESLSKSDETIETPDDVKKGYADNTGMNSKDPVKEIVRLLENGDLSESGVVKGIRDIENACISKFNRSPIDIKASIYKSLDISGFAEGRLKELAMVIETIYAKRFQKQLFDLEDIMFRLIEEGVDSEEELKKIIANLRHRYTTSFNRADQSAEDFFSDYFKTEDLNKTDFEGLVELIKAAYMQKFGNTFHFMSESLHRDIMETVHSIKERDNSINALLEQVLEQNKTRDDLGQKLKGKLSDNDHDQT